MVIYGEPIARIINRSLKHKLKKINHNPILAIILVGNDKASLKYVHKKQELAKRLGIRVILNKLPPNINQDKVLKIISQYNADKKICAIVIQLPIPNHLDTQNIINAVNRNKDVDGFTKNSRFKAPIAIAVIRILRKIYRKKYISKTKPAFKQWLYNLKIIVIGKGRTGGKPIFQELSKINDNCLQIDSKTKNPNQFIEKADLIISCTGIRNFINKNNCPKNAILIGVGLHNENGKLKGDYQEEEIKNIAGFYAPTPRGIGPVNVACLMENVVSAAGKQETRIKN